MILISNLIGVISSQFKRFDRKSGGIKIKSILKYEWKIIVIINLIFIRFI